MSRTKKIAILAIIAMVLTLMPAALFASDNLAGTDRIGTAIKIADAGWPTAGTVVLAPADQANLVDALAAAPLAGQENAPILLTFKGSLNASVKAKIAALGATKVYVVGAIADSVVAEVEAMNGVTAEKLSGANRWATAKAINDKLTSPAGTFVVGQNAIADALSVASYAAANKYAIVLAKTDGTVDASSLYGSKTYLVGGTAVVKDYAGAVDRFGGADRFATNAAVAAGLTFSYDKVYVAGGLNANLVDALAVAPLAAKANAFVALANGNSVAADVKGSAAIAVGGVVTEAARAAVLSGDLAVVSVSAINATQLEVKFNKAVDKDTLIADANGTFVANTVSLTALDGAAHGGITGSLSDDGVTLKITAANALSKRYDLVVENAKAKAGEKVQKYNQMITIAADKTAPTIVSTVKKSSSTYEVTFSEPIDTLGTITLKYADGTTAAGLVTNNHADGKEKVTFTIDNAVTAGKVINVTFVGAQDQNANLLTPNPATVSLTKGALDGAKPTVSSVTQTGAKTFNVKFSEELIGAPTVTLNGGATTETKDKNDSTVYKVEATVVLDGAMNVAVSSFTDLSGEAGNTVTQVVTFVKDTAAPKVASAVVAVDSSDMKEYLDITFDKDVYLNVPTVDAVGSYVKDYVTTNINPAATAVAYKDADNKKVLRVALANLVSGSDVKGAVYTVDLAFANVASGADVAADTAKKVSFTRGEDGVASNNTKVAVVAGTLKQGADNNKVEVVFSEAVDGATAVNTANYTIDGAVVESVTLLPVGEDTPSTVVDAADQAVVINLKANSNLFTGVRNITIAGVKAKGSTVAMDTYTTNAVSLKENVVPTATAKLTATNKVTLTFSEAVNQTVAVDDATDFELYIGGAKLASNDAVTLLVADSGDGVTTLVLTLEADVTADNLSKGLVLKALGGLNIVDAAGNKLSVPTAGITVTQ